MLTCRVVTQGVIFPYCPSHRGETRVRTQSGGVAPRFAAWLFLVLLKTFFHSLHLALQVLRGVFFPLGPPLFVCQI